MEPRTKSVTVTAEIKADMPEGRATAAVVKFGAVDLDGDVVLRSAWPAGAIVPIQPAHDWNAPPLGEGITAQAGDWGTIELDFFLKTSLGRDWYEAVKARGPRQQWSFGYRVLDAEPGKVDGKSVQLLKELAIFEASPVLLGAQPLSHTMSIKSGGERLADQGGRVLAELEAYVSRAKEVAALRTGEGRPLSDGLRADLTALLERLDALLGLKGEVDRLLAPSTATATLLAAVAEYQATRAYYRLEAVEE